MTCGYLAGKENFFSYITNIQLGFKSDISILFQIQLYAGFTDPPGVIPSASE